MKFEDSCLCYFPAGSLPVTTSSSGQTVRVEGGGAAITCSSEPHMCTSHGNYGAQRSSVGVRDLSVHELPNFIYETRRLKVHELSNTQHLLDVRSSVDSVQTLSWNTISHSCLRHSVNERRPLVYFN